MRPRPCSRTRRAGKMAGTDAGDRCQARGEARWMGEQWLVAWPLWDDWRDILRGKLPTAEESGGPSEALRGPFGGSV